MKSNEGRRKGTKARRSALRHWHSSFIFISGSSFILALVVAGERAYNPPISEQPTTDAEANTGWHTSNSSVPKK
jgi:hypothetical protein